MNKESGSQQGRSGEEREQHEKFSTILLIIILTFFAVLGILNYFVPGFV